MSLTNYLSPASLSSPYFQSFTQNANRRPVLSDDMKKEKEFSSNAIKILTWENSIKFLKHDWKEPSVTWLGRAVDWLLGAGEYAEKNKVNSIGKRTLLDLEDCDSRGGICLSMATGLEVKTEENSNCSFIDQVTYINFLHYKMLTEEDRILRSCFNEWKYKCAINCLTCTNATNIERIERLDSDSPSFNFFSSFVQGREWYILTLAPENVNKWKYSLIKNIIQNVIIPECELKEQNADEMRNKIILISVGCSLAVIGVVVGIVGIIAFKKNSQQRNTSKETLLLNKI